MPETITLFAVVTAATSSPKAICSAGSVVLEGANTVGCIEVAGVDDEREEPLAVFALPVVLLKSA